jgi:hypothetical protein
MAEQQSAGAGWFSLPVPDTPSGCAASLLPQPPQQQQQQEHKGGDLDWQALPGFSSQQTAVPAAATAAAAAEVAAGDVWLELPGLQPDVFQSGLEQQQQQQQQQQWPPQATSSDSVEKVTDDTLTTQHSQQQQHPTGPQYSCSVSSVITDVDEQPHSHGLTAATAKALRENLWQAAALSGQQLHSHGMALQQQQLGFDGCYTGQGLGLWPVGLGAAAVLCCEDMVASNALDVFVGSSLGHIRRKLAGKTSAALSGPALAAQQQGVAIDQCHRAGQHQEQLQQRQQQSLEAGQGSMLRPSARPHSGYQYTTLEDTLAFIRKHRAGSMGAVSRR